MTQNNLNTDKDKTMSRRSFFKLVSGAFTGLIVLTLGIPLVDSIVGTIKNKKNTTYSKITSVNSIPENNPVNLPFTMTKVDAYIKNIQPENVWAVKLNEPKVTVYSPICPHLGCRYQWHPDRRLFICPCHHSIFKLDGQVVSGPAPRPLDTLPTKVKNNYLFVLWERFQPGIAKKEIISE